MKLALVNPWWTFDRSIYFGCREPHLPLEFGYAKALLEARDHEARIFDAHLHQIALDDLVAELERFDPDVLVVTTAPSYLFWRCAPPELRVPHAVLAATRHLRAQRVVVGPHASTTPTTTLRKLEADVAVVGECEEILVQLAEAPASAAATVRGDGRHVGGATPHASDMSRLPALRWEDSDIHRHSHHHHRFDAAPSGPGAEMEVSRGCPYHCSFCAKDNFRSDYRKRPLETILTELDRLLAQGIEYVYFIDEIFLPNRDLLEALAARPVKFGIQTRIDLWSPANIELLGVAGCVSIEAGVESITVDGRNLLDKGSRLSTEAIAERLIRARAVVPFVQANLLESGSDDPDAVAAWREHLLGFGVWANQPVPMFDYPGSPGYSRRWGVPDDLAWERAVDDYLARHRQFSDIQEQSPARLPELEPWVAAGSSR